MQGSQNTKIILNKKNKVVKTATATAAKSLQSCPTLRDPIDGSPLGSPVPGILQARILEWVAISSRASSAKTRGFHTQLDEGPETP